MPRVKSRRRFLGIMLLSLVVAPLSSKGDSFEPVREEIKNSLIQQQIPSLAVAVARDGKVIWEEGFGWANRENRVRANEHTLYSLASISKPITATGLMILVEREKVDLDTSANDYLGEAKIRARVGDSRDATVRRLANHTSGLPLHYQFFYADESFRRPAPDESIRRYGQLMWAPGERYQYANFGYGILDYIIARAGGVNYAEFMRREVFLPLGMTRTSVGIGPGLGSNVAVRYARDQTPLPFYDFDHPGASAVFSSAHDLIRFGLFHLNQRTDDQKAILSDKSIDEMQRGTAESGKGRKYGIGWSMGEQFGYQTCGHTGGMGGVQTQLLLLPDEQIAVVTLCNYNTDLPYRITKKILASLLPDYAKQLKQKEKTPPNQQNGKAEFKPPKELAARWAGDVETYAGKRSIELLAKPSGDIHVKFHGQLWTLLNNPRVVDGFLLGVFAGDIGTPDADRRRHHLHLRAKLRGNVMNGALTAISTPGRRTGNALSYWVEMKKQPSESE